MSSQVGARIHADVAAMIANFEDRRVGSAGHLAARQWAERRLGELGLTPYAGEGFVLPYGPRSEGSGLYLDVG